MTAAAIRLDAPVQRLANCTALRIAYIAARIQLVVNRRMKASNLADVGHILSRNGTSTKMRMRPETLRAVKHQFLFLPYLSKLNTGRKIMADVHAYDTEDNPNRVEREDASNANGKANDDRHHTRPENQS